MKHIIKETLNEKVFVELYAETNEGKVEYCVSALFRYTHKSGTQSFISKKQAKEIYEFIINN